MNAERFLTDILILARSAKKSLERDRINTAINKLDDMIDEIEAEIIILRKLTYETKQDV